MRLSNHLLIGLIVFGFCGMSGLLTPTASQAVQSGQPDDNLNQHCTEVPPWRGVIPGDERFVPTFVDDVGVAHAYCDRQTGLVWDAAPVDENTTFDWPGALSHCISRTMSWNGQLGGRLPSIPELASLVDTSSSTCTVGVGSFCLPDGHPFSHVQPSSYWSATEWAGDSGRAWRIFFRDGTTLAPFKGSTIHAWCVRGAMNADVY